jgi:MFS family permease
MWCTHLPFDVPSAGSTHEIHPTPVDVHCSRVRLLFQLLFPRNVFNLSRHSGMVGQYLAGPFIGKLVDSYGPRLCSLTASILFTSTFGLSAWIYSSTPQDINHPSSFSFNVLTICFGFAGVAQACSWVYAIPQIPHFTNTTFSFFSSLFAATKNFPSLIGTASAASMVMYGLSPLFLSSFATHIFTDSQSGLDLAQYLTFLALLCGTVNLFGALVLTVPESHAVLETTNEESQTSPDETTRLLSSPKKCDEYVHVTAVQEPDELSLVDLLRDPYFCVLFVFMSLTIGCVSLPVLPRKWR